LGGEACGQTYQRGNATYILQDITQLTELLKAECSLRMFYFIGSLQYVYKEQS